MSKKAHRILLIAAGVLVAVLVLVLAYELIFASSRRRWKLPELPGAAGSADLYDPGLLSPGLLKIIQNKLLVQVSVDSVTVDGLLVSAYETPARQTQEGSRTGLYLASDQIAYGRGLARMGKKADFNRWLQAFDQAFGREGEPFHASHLTGQEDFPSIVQRGPAHWSVTLSYTRALLEGYRAFGGKALAARIMDLSDRLLPLFQEKETASPLIAGPRTLLAYDEWDTPPPDTVPEPGEEQPLEHALGTHLAEIDCWTLLALSRFDAQWAPLAADWQKILTRARLDGPLPLYASALGDDGETYLAVTGESTLSSLREELLINLHLAEVGQTDSEFISWLRSQLRDNKELPSGWNPVNGQASSAQAQSADYALALLLGRAAGDQLLMDEARQALMTAYASSQTSDILGGWYRAGKSQRTFLLVAEDNTAVLVSLR